MLVQRGEEIIYEAEAIGPTATVDPAPMLHGPWWAERPWFTDPALSATQLKYLDDAGYGAHGSLLVEFTRHMSTRPD